jgi:hypothetical protein
MSLRALAGKVFVHFAPNDNRARDEPRPSTPARTRRSHSESASDTSSYASPSPASSFHDTFTHMQHEDNNMSGGAHSPLPTSELRGRTTTVTANEPAYRASSEIRSHDHVKERPESR